LGAANVMRYFRKESMEGLASKTTCRRGRGGKKNTTEKRDWKVIGGHFGREAQE